MTIKFQREKADRSDSKVYIEYLMNLLGHPEALVTDIADIGDFSSGLPMEERKAIARDLSEKLGFEICLSSRIVDVAEKLKKYSRLSATTLLPQCGTKQK